MENDQVARTLSSVTLTLSGRTYGRRCVQHGAEFQEVSCTFFSGRWCFVTLMPTPTPRFALPSPQPTFTLPLQACYCVSWLKNKRKSWLAMTSLGYCPIIVFGKFRATHNRVLVR